MPDMYSGVFYTRGETMMIGNVTFLVAYAQQRKTFTQEELEELVNEGWRPIPPTPDTPLSLSLLNLQSCGHLKDIRPFDLASEIRGERWQEAINAEVVTRLRQLSIAVIMYVQDHDEQFPPMRTPEEAKAAVLRYVGNEKLFVHPETGEAYMCNPLLDRIHEAEVKNPLDTVVWYEASPAPDGTRAVSFAGGNARRMPEAEWQQMKQKAGIP